MHLCVYGCRPVRPRWWPAGNRKHGSVSEARKHSRNLSQSIVSLIQNDFVPHLRSWKLQVASVPCLSDACVHCGGVATAASVHMVLTNKKPPQQLVSLSATNLKGADVSGLSDPFVCFQGDAVLRSVRVYIKTRS